MNITARLALKMLARGIRNKFAQLPLSVSFEVTHYCTANCWHCNWGGPVKGESRLQAEDYAAICRELRPAVSHISGGEPLARGDVYEIARAMANPGDLPWMVLVSNAAALTVDKYWKLREAGINQFSISLDFPDERHSEFRRIPGLFEKMDRVIPEITALGNGDLSLNSCITAWNYRDLPAMVELARRWNTSINFSVYSPLRVNDENGLPRPDQLQEVRDCFQRVIDMKKAGFPVYSSERVMWKYYRFFTERGIPGCQAGRRFLVINPDGALTPCAMVWAKYRSQRDMLREFTANNTCESCYISTRANTEKTLADFLADNREMLLERFFKRRRPPGRSATPLTGPDRQPSAQEEPPRKSMAAG
ncbi:MAG: radical SAM protein [Gemmatimonadota bacterium]|nr:MAG: radical SAM protein [Gemmatimonadota bacterium]